MRGAMSTSAALVRDLAVLQCVALPISLSMHARRLTRMFLREPNENA